MNIGQRMRDRRIELNINPKEIAKKIGKSVSTYYRYETGEIEKLTITKMCEIAEYLQVSPVYLLLGTDSETKYKTEKNKYEKSPVIYNISNFSTSTYKASEPSTSYANEEYSTQKIQEILSSLEMSLEELSSLTQISVDRLKTYQNGNVYVDHSHIQAISEVLNIPIIEILYKRDDTSLLKKISKLNAIEIKEVEQFIDSMKRNANNNKKSGY